MRKSYLGYLDKSWKSIQTNFPLFAAVGLLILISASTVNIFPILGGSFMTLLFIGYFVALKKMTNSEEFGFQDIFWCFLDFKRFLNAILLSFLHSVGIVLGMILLIIPGIWIAVRWSLAFPLLAHPQYHEVSAWEILKASSHFVKGNWWWFAGLLVGLAILNFLGFLFFGLGLLITLPMSLIILNDLVDDLVMESGSKTGLTEVNPQLTGSTIKVSP
jgi:hypothetical protein